MPGTIFCPHCGAQNTDDDLFCVSCGKKLAVPSAGTQGANYNYADPQKTKLSDKKKGCIILTVLFYAIMIFVTVFFLTNGGDLTPGLILATILVVGTPIAIAIYYFARNKR